MKPDINEVLRRMKLKKELDEAYDELDRWANEQKDLYGTVRFDYEISPFELEGDVFEFASELDGKYLKFELTDNVQRLQNGEMVWKSVPFKPTSFKIQSLKTKPKGLK